MIEYGFDATVNYLATEKEFNANGWFPSIDACLIAVKEMMEKHDDATSFVFSIVRRSHVPMSQRLR